MASIDPLASGLLSILAAGVAAAGAVYQAIQRQQAERERETRAAQDREREREREAVSKRLSAVEQRTEQHGLALTEHRTEQRSLVQKIDRLERGVEGLGEKLDRLLGAVIGRPRRDTR